MVDTSQNKDDAITLWQLFAILEGMIVGVGVLSMARTVSYVAGHSAWLSVLLAGISVIPFLWFYKALAERFPGYTVVEYADIILGPWLGKAVSVLYIATELMISAIMLRTTADFIAIWFLPSTDINGIIIIMLMLTIYAVMGGIKVVARTSEIIFFFLLPFFILMLLPLRRIDFNNIQPLLDNNVLGIIKGIWPAWFNIMGLEALYMISAFVNKKSSIFRVSAIAVGLNTLLYVVVVISNIGVIGINAIKYLNYPLIYYIKNEKFPFFERVDLFFAFFWSFSFFIIISITFYAATLATSQLINIKPQYGKYSSFVLGIISFFLARLPQNTSAISRYTSIIMYIVLPMILLLPGLLLLIAVIRKINIKGDGS